jgi:hypothetical protein
MLAPLEHPLHSSFPSAGCTPAKRCTPSSSSRRCADFICASPLLPSCGLTRSQVEEEVGQWADLGDQVIANLGMPPRQQLEPKDKWVGSLSALMAPDSTAQLSCVAACTSDADETPQGGQAGPSTAWPPAMCRLGALSPGTTHTCAAVSLPLCVHLLHCLQAPHLPVLPPSLLLVPAPAAAAPCRRRCRKRHSAAPTGAGHLSAAGLRQDDAV